MESLHTPGPWEVYKKPNGTVYEGGEAKATIRGGCSSDFFVAIMPPKTGTMWTVRHEANANLIAAAPEMLESLKRLLNLTSAANELEIVEAWQGARDAIAKAKGEDQ